MPVSFPASPSIGQVSVQNGRTYTWSGYAWELTSNVSAHASTHSAGGSDAISIDTAQLLDGFVYDCGAYAAIAPAAPTSLSAASGVGGVPLSWTAPANTGGLSLTDYVIQYSSDSGATWTTFTRAASTATSATVTGLVTGTSYVFRVAAVNGVGTGTYTGASNSATSSSLNLTVSPSSGTADIGTAYSWSGSGTAASPLETSDSAAPNGIQWTFAGGANTYDLWQFTCGVSGTLTFELGAGFDGDGGAERPNFERYLRNGVQSTTFVGGTTNLGDHYIRRSLSVSAGDVIRLGRASPAFGFASSEMLKGKIRLWIS